MTKTSSTSRTFRARRFVLPLAVAAVAGGAGFAGYRYHRDAQAKARAKAMERHPSNGLKNGVKSRSAEPVVESPEPVSERSYLGVSALDAPAVTTPFSNEPVEIVEPQRDANTSSQTAPAVVSTPVKQPRQRGIMGTANRLYDHVERVSDNYYDREAEWDLRRELRKERRLATKYAKLRATIAFFSVLILLCAVVGTGIGLLAASSMNPDGVWVISGTIIGSAAVLYTTLFIMWIRKLDRINELRQIHTYESSRDYEYEDPDFLDHMFINEW